MKTSHFVRTMLLGAAWGLSALAVTDASYAQVTRYQPNSPTVSPYLDLTRTNIGGGLPNYYAFVRPKQRQAAINQHTQSELNQQYRSLGRLRRDVEKEIPPIASTGTGSWHMHPGSKTSFRNTTQYYPEVSLRRTRR